MENKKSSVLKKQKLSIKSKLMAAVAMLVVSTMLLSTTTYAWFVLSTAPEVKGMTTTVGSNGNLEIALLNDTTGADMTTISSGIGTSYYVENGSWLTTNVTWGNLVDLSDASYGLRSADLKLYPSVLKAANTTDKKLVDQGDIFSFAQYGYDGRVTTLGGTTYSGVYDTTLGFVIDESTHYGVRGIGSARGSIDENLFTFNRNRNLFLDANLAGEASSVISRETVQGLLDIIVYHSTFNASETTPTELYNTYITRQGAQVLVRSTAALSSAVSELTSFADTMEEKTKNAIVAESYTEGHEHVAIQDLDATYMASYNGALKPLWDQIQTFKTNLAAITVPTANDLEWSAVSGPLNALMNTANQKLFLVVTQGSTTTEYDVAELRGMTQEQKTEFGNSLLAQGTVMYALSKDGLFADVADFIGNYQTRTYSGITVEYGGFQPQVNVGFAGEKSVETPAVTAATTLVDAFTYASGTNSGSGVNSIGTFYGYAIDFAFRTNAADSNLILSAAQNRVKDQAATAGSGSTFTFAEGANTDSAKALRFAFVDAQNNVLAIAKLAENAVGGVYQLVLYEVAQEGTVLSADTANPISDYVITDLAANTEKRITVIVYLDGNDVDEGMVSATGMLNLQFASSAQLTPMDYDFGGNNQTITSVLSADPTSIEVGETSELSLTVNGQAYTGEVTYSSSDTDVATISGNVVTGVAAGTVTITATVAGEDVATVEITVTTP